MNFLQSYWFKIPWWSLRKVTYIVLLALLGSLLIGITILVLYMNSLPSLSSWHTKVLKNEFTAVSDIKDFTAYRALEKTLFKELNQEIYKKISHKEVNAISRYTSNSISDPKRWNQAWNQSFELPVKNPKMGVLLLHGMSDSPYSLHTQAKYLQEQGVWVVALRMPGHGTIPSGLVNLQWQDMAAVVKLGMAHLSNTLPEKPIHIMGYSTGAPLALHYTLLALEDSNLTLPSSLIFYSPAIGVSKAAPLAIWQSRLGHLFSLPKLEWNSIAPEFDPFKYNSFAVNAGDQVYRLCNTVQKQLDHYSQQTDTKPFPPILSFASIIDSTVSTPATINKLYKRLEKGDHQLVLFDINHNFSDNHFVKKTLNTSLDILRKTPSDINYTFDLISNIHSKNRMLHQVRNGKDKTNLKISWNKHLHSLSHLSLPISPLDPLYGSQKAPKSPGIQLGHLAIYGETSVLQISAASLLRQRWNPFHDYTKQRVLTFMNLD